jgi:FHS family L-fucose permease-like MFS transporter
MQGSVWNASDVEAGNHVFYYWGGALVGRFVGAFVLGVASPGKVLALVAGGAITLILVSANTTGAVSGWALLAIGLTNAIMFPTIFSLASQGLGTRAAEGSGVIATAIVGGAIIPWLTGGLADLRGLHFALVLPAACYVCIVLFGIYCSATATPVDPVERAPLA